MEFNSTRSRTGSNVLVTYRYNEENHPQSASRPPNYQPSPDFAAHSIPSSASLAKVGQPVSGSQPSIW